ncbi:DUF4350 domain-containing protein [Pedobacter sp. L105]|uniref:DUF4350 domain-containing protein n=1 Tax=Pedobacter sp. L105 TaxID=1641871 RepID=UPI00131DF3E5|nr:DUF4350 domain-containing protein [Pedobacter sp. L105]
MKGLRLYLIGSAVVMVLYLIAQYYKPKPTDWTPTYLREDKIPFGLYLLQQEMGTLFPGTSIKTSRLPVYNTLRGKNLSHTNYLFIGGDLKFDALDYRELISFMKRGNHVFIAATDIGDLLNDKLKLRIKTVLTFAEKKSIPVSFVNPALQNHGDYIFDKGISDQHFGKIDTLRATILGKNADGQVNFVKYTFGKGALYILPNPQLLTNYSLLTPHGAAYATRALSYLPNADNLIWDENNTKGGIEGSSLFRVIFAHAPLRWAYELAIGGLLIFVFYEMKRRQRIIPVVAPLNNSSADFIQVVGKVYYQQRDNRDISQKKISYFLEYIRTTYRLKTTTIDEELVTALTVKSGVPEENIRQLLDAINGISPLKKVSDQQLINLNKLMENFYIQAQ